MRSKARRRLAVAAGAAVFATGLIGVAHAPFARSRLMTLTGCPMGGRHMTPVESENARRMALAVYRGGHAESARARPALGFTLDATTLDDVRAWEQRMHVDCEDLRVDLIHCAAVRPDAFGLPATQGTVDELALEFDRGGRLVNVTTFRMHRTPDVASEQAHAIVSSLAQRLGPAGVRAGDFKAASFVAPSAASISTVMYRYRDYVAEVTGMNAPSGGASIREHYMSAND
jgi:hypothetical protein